MRAKCNICLVARGSWFDSRFTIHDSRFLKLLCFCVICLPLPPRFAAQASSGGGSEQPQDDAIGIVLDVLKSDDQQMQAVAIAMVKEMPGTEVTEILATELPNLSAASQVQLLSALGDRGDVAALPAVIVAAKATDESVRIAALRALGQLGNASTVGLLAQTAADTSGDEQKTARESLYRLRDPTVDAAILAAIPGAEPKTKVELISSVGQRNISAGVSTLLKTALVSAERAGAGKDSDSPLDNRESCIGNRVSLIKSRGTSDERRATSAETSGRVRAESFKVLKVIAGPQHLPVLVDLLINVQSTSDRNPANGGFDPVQAVGLAEKTVVAVAHKIEDKNRQAEAVLAVLPSVEDIESRCSLLSVLGKIGDSSALPCLREALESSDAEIQGAAIRALADWPTSEPASDLLNMAQISGNSLHRILALRGAVRLLGLDSRPIERAAPSETIDERRMTSDERPSSINRRPSVDETPRRPAGETIEMYSRAMSLAPDAAEKKRVLSGLASTKSFDALLMAADYLQDETLFREAELAVVKIAECIYRDDYGSGLRRDERGAQQTAAVLTKIIQTSKNDLLRQQAKEVMNQIDRLGITQKTEDRIQKTEDRNLIPDF